jgi:hypothetical protein
MSCGSGCTDCPTCRGEVQPDSPVMKDMAFAMAMHRDPHSWDPVMSPHTVAQTVRDGVQRRGGAAPGDVEVLRTVQQAISTLGSPTPWLNPGHGHDGLRFSPQGGPGPAPAPAPPPARVDPLSKKPPAVLDAPVELLESLDKWRPPPLPDAPTSGGSRGKCCPEMKYPSRLDLPVYSDPVKAASDPEEFKKLGFESIRVTRAFDWEVEFLTPSRRPGCYCECCEFVHVIVRSVYTLVRVADPENSERTEANAAKANPPEKSNTTEPREDKCTFVVIENGKWKKRHESRGWKPSDPNADENKGKTWDGPHCYGDRDSPKGIPPGCPPDLVPPKSRPDPCHINANDNPGRGIPLGHEWTWLWMSVGIVYDTCLGKVADAQFVWWSIKGTAPWPPGKPTFDDGPGGQDEKQTGRVTFPGDR